MAHRQDLAADVSTALAAVPPEEVENLKVAQKARRTEAVSLALSGVTYEQIGQRLGISAKAAHNLVHRTIEETRNYAVDELRAVENARLDRAQAAIWSDVLSGDLKAVNTFLRISERRAKMNGLDAPAKVAMAVSVRQEMENALQTLEKVILHEEVSQPAQDVIEAEEANAKSFDYFIDPMTGAKHEPEPGPGAPDTGGDAAGSDVAQAERVTGP